VIKEFKNLIESYRTITVLTHINPDPDTIGTALGIYNILKENHKKVEIVSFSVDLPINIDFLPNFSRIKHKMSYDNSLIIACDAGSIDRLGFKLENRVIVNIDHHKTNTHYGYLNIVDSSLVSASLVAYNFLSENFIITKNTATCFYTALLSDSKNFSTDRVDKNIFSIVLKLLDIGVEHNIVINNLNSRNSLASIRLEAKALDKLKLHQNATIASIKIDNSMIIETGAKMTDTVKIIDIISSLATVKIAIVIIENNSDIKVSFRSKSIDLSTFAESFGGGGHPFACGFNIKNSNLEEVLDRILVKLNMEIL